MNLAIGRNSLRVRGLSRAAILTGALLLFPLTGCAGDTSPGEAVPALRQALSRVDEAVAAERYGRARAELTALVRQTVEAQEAGRISDEDAARILAAAAQLSASLPESSPTPTVTASPGQGETDKKDEEKKKEEEKEDEKKEEGDGDSGGNGPDDGHGN